jgi:hypothetical protein
MLVCGIGVAATWCIGSSAGRINDRAFTKVDEVLAAGSDRLVHVQQRMQELRIASGELGENLKEWIGTNAQDRLALRIGLDRKAQELTTGMQQADAWLELSAASIAMVGPLLDVAHSAGIPVEAAMLSPALDNLAWLRDQLARATATVDAIREHMTQVAGEDLQAERINRAAGLVAPLVVTFADLDVRVGDALAAVQEIRSKAQAMKSKVHARIVAAQIGAMVLTGWMLLGQIFLARHGWNGLRQSS